MKTSSRINPFVTIGYQGPEYFCDREKETDKLFRELTNGNNVVLLAHRRMGKTGLIRHCVHTKELNRQYNVFIVDILSAKNLKDFTLMLANSIVYSLKKFDERALDMFLKIVSSLQGAFSSPLPGEPFFKMQYVGLPDPEHTLEQIFSYIGNSKKPCIVAIDEFQQVEKFPETETESLLRTYTQTTPESRFIFAGSERRTMGRMFTSENRPFYQSATPLHLEKIDIAKYTEFIKSHFNANGKDIEDEVITTTYGFFNGITWYIQKMMNEMFSLVPKKGECTMDTFKYALEEILQSYDYIYEESLYKIPEKQKELLIAIAKEGPVKEMTSEAFSRKYGLYTSSIQSARKGLINKEYITEDLGKYYIYDKFFEIWLNTRF